MARTSTKRPTVRSEAEEADWYTTPEGRQQTRKEFQRAMRGGKLATVPSSGVPRTDSKVLWALMEQAKAKATRAISIRLPVADLELAKDIAKKQGIGYQTVLKHAIRKGLKKAG